MEDNKNLKLSKRERQIMDIIYKKEQLSAKQVQDEMPDPPSYSAIRTLLKILVNKEFLKIKKEGLKYIYFPVISKKKASVLALKNIITTYFNNSIEETVAAVLEISKNNLSQDDITRLSKIIENKKKEE